MRRSNRASLAAAFMAASVALLNTACSPSAETQEMLSVSEESQALIRLPTENWATNGGDLYNRRYSPLTEIHRENVGDLKGVWRARLGGSGVGPQYSGEAQPIVVDGVIYIVTGADDVFA